MTIRGPGGPLEDQKEDWRRTRRKTRGGLEEDRKEGRKESEEGKWLVLPTNGGQGAGGRGEGREERVIKGMREEKECQE